ncbi:MAG: type III polyketide synthase [Planctomycetes bacterium]|nr:type III polyketide synthase [Planctomycetota bacterium]
MRIASVARALPEHQYAQTDICAKLQEIWADHPSIVNRLPQLHANTQVETRHLALPLEEYGKPRSFGEANDAWIKTSVDLGEKALRRALEPLGLSPQDIDAIFAVSITGVASPSLDARLANKMRFRSDIKRVPIFGLGCVAGAAGIARAVDYVRAFPDQVAVLVSVELSSLTFQAEDHSVANLISCGLFGDGAAAVVVLGEERARKMEAGGLRVRDTRSIFYHDTEDVMGWRISERGFDIVLSPAVPRIAESQVAPGLDAFLLEHGIEREEIDSWVCHPGGPKVLDGLAKGLGLGRDAVSLAWKTLAEQGNLSSTSVLMVLEETLRQGSPGEDALGMILAMGPAFCSELVLFDWSPEPVVPQCAEGSEVVAGSSR